MLCARRVQKFIGKKDEEENKKQVFQVKKPVGLPPILEILAPFGRCCVIKIIL